jgi:hypothetical protein
MIEQYLSNSNENGTVLILLKKLELNKILVHPKTKNFLRFSITSNLAAYASSIKNIDENKN